MLLFIALKTLSVQRELKTMSCISDQAPEFEETEAEPQVRAEEGNYVILHCVARGRPVPTITWTKGAVVVCLLHMCVQFYWQSKFHYA
jgi:hypothetical protein